MASLKWSPPPNFLSLLQLWLFFNHTGPTFFYRRTYSTVASYIFNYTFYRQEKFKKLHYQNVILLQKGPVLFLPERLPAFSVPAGRLDSCSAQQNGWLGTWLHGCLLAHLYSPEISGREKKKDLWTKGNMSSWNLWPSVSLVFLLSLKWRRHGSPDVRKTIHVESVK
jgi:hypothetical protein